MAVVLIIYLELELHSLEGSGGLDGPDTSLLCHLHHRGGDGCGFPQEEVYIEGLIA